jgi:hypothetical protein
MPITVHERESINVLSECIDLQTRKGQDYQSKASPIKQADYYLNGVDTIYDIMWAKMLRLKSLQEKAKYAPADAQPNFESLADSAMDLINYASFYVSWLRGRMEGQDTDNDMFNRPKQTELDLQNPLIDGTVKILDNISKVKNSGYAI